MNLVIDIGNTAAKIAVFDEKKLVKTFQGNNQSLNELSEIAKKYPLQKGVIASVITLTNDILDQLEALGIGMLHVNSETPIPITNSYKTPQTLGMDRLAAVVAVGAFRYAPVNDAQSSIGSSLQSGGQSLFFAGGECRQHPIRQIVIGMGFGTHTDLHPGEVLASNTGNDGLDSVVSAGAAFSPDAEPAGLQGNIVKHDDDILGRNVEKGGKLLYGLTGKVHIGLGLEKEQFVVLVGNLVIQALEFTFVYPAAQLFCQNIKGAEASIVAGLCVFGSGIAETHDEPILHI